MVRKLVSIALGFCSLLPAQANLTVLKAARMFDARSGTVTQPGLVVIMGDKIQAVGVNAPAGAKVIDLGDATLLPGFIDSHTHLSMMFSTDYSA